MTWGQVMRYVGEAKRHRDPEVRSAILNDLVTALEQLDQDREAELESAFRNGVLAGQESANHSLY